MFKEQVREECDQESTEIAAISIIKETTDEWYKKRYHQILKHPKRYKDWKIVNGSMYKYRPAADISDIIADLDAWKLVIPKEKRAGILFESHNEPTSAHPVKERTFQRIAQNYDWVGFYEHVAKYVRGCKICQQYKNDQREKVGLMGTREVTKPWEAICTDLIGEFPRSNNGNKYLLIFEDIFSRFIICTPIRNKKGKIIKKALEELVCTTFGTPERLFTDGGKEYKNEEVQNFLEDGNIEYEQTPVTSAQCNPTERVNRDFKVRIAAYMLVVITRIGMKIYCVFSLRIIRRKMQLREKHQHF